MVLRQIDTAAVQLAKRASVTHALRCRIILDKHCAASVWILTAYLDFAQSGEVPIVMYVQRSGSRAELADWKTARIFTRSLQKHEQAICSTKRDGNEKPCSIFERTAEVPLGVPTVLRSSCPESEADPVLRVSC